MQRTTDRATAFVMLVGLATVAHAADTYDPASRQLTIASVAIGPVTYANLVVTPGRILSGPSGTAPAGAADAYDPRTQAATLQSVTVGGSTYHNVVVSVAGLVSIGSVTGADTYDGTTLAIPRLQAGSAFHAGVAVTVGRVVSVSGGMPTAGPDTYDGITNQLAIPAVQVAGKVYTNVVVQPSGLTADGGVYETITESTPYSFSVYCDTYGNTNCANPDAPLIQGSDGDFYGVTLAGGTADSGAVYRITAAGAETVLYSFQGYANGTGIFGSDDGAQPVGALVEGPDGGFYGATMWGGTSNTGTVYRVSPAGQETILYDFGAFNTPNPFLPSSGLIIGSDGNFYGTTEGGGDYGSGTVYRMTPAGVVTVIYSFCALNPPTGCTDGSGPLGGVIEGADGSLYGTTVYGGAYDVGTIFRISPDGQETVLHAFTGDGAVSGSQDGALPYQGLVQGGDGSFYGVTLIGGMLGGVAFRVDAAGNYAVLHVFTGNDQGNPGTADGSQPAGALIEGSDGNFYGTTLAGGAYGNFSNGTAFKMTPTGVLTVIHSFSGNSAVLQSADGGLPEAALLEGHDGNFYGTTYYGGTANEGTAFRLNNVIPAP